jgi:Neuraminidase (sialidase)
VCDPDTAQPVRAGTNIPDVAVDPNTGAIYVVWADGRFSGGTKTDVVLSKSTDGGKTWSTPIKLDQGSGSSQAFTPAVAVADNGAVGVSLYDFRNNTPAAGLPTDAWLETSQDGGATWAEDRLTPTSFNMEAAPISRGFFLGDYEGLTAIGNDFLAFFAMANNNTPSNPTDIFSVRASAP